MVTTKTFSPFAVRNAFGRFQILFHTACSSLVGIQKYCCDSSVRGCNLCSASFLKGSNSLFSEGTKVQSKNFSICHQILESHLKEESLLPRKEKRLFSGHHFCSSEKSPDVAVFFKAEYCPRWRRKHWQAEKEIPGVPRQRRRGAARPGLRTSQLFVGGGESLFPRKKWLPLGAAPLRNRLRDPRRP